MLLHKTPRNRRNTYTYRFTGDAGEQTVTLRPGENGVTAQDIELLHRADDSEVYYNLKAVNPEMSLSPEERRKRRAEKDAWAEKYIGRFLAEYGYIPGDADLADAVNEAFPKNRISSVDELQENCGDRSYAPAYSAGTEKGEEHTAVGRMREIVADMSEMHRTVYKLTKIDGISGVDTAKELHISPARVSQILSEIRAVCAEDKKLKNFFRPA